MEKRGGIAMIPTKRNWRQALRRSVMTNVCDGDSGAQNLVEARGMDEPAGSPDFA